MENRSLPPDPGWGTPDKVTHNDPANFVFYHCAEWYLTNDITLRYHWDDLGNSSQVIQERGKRQLFLPEEVFVLFTKLRKR